MTTTSTETPPTNPPDTPEPAPAPTPAASVRSVVYGGLAVCAVAGAAAAFSLGGPIALAVFGGAALVSPAVARRVVKGPSRRKSFGLNPRRLLSGTGGSRKSSGPLSWPFTGNQSRRAQSKTTRTRVAGRSGSLPKLATGARSGLPKLGGGRARKAGAAGRGASPRMALPVRPATRPVGAGTKMRPAGRPAAGTGRSRAPKPATAPRTPSKTPARPGARPRLTSPSPKTGARRPSGATPRVPRTATRGTRKPKLSTPGTAGRRGVSPVSRKPPSGHRGTTPARGRGRGHLRALPGGLRGASKLGTRRTGSGLKAARPLGTSTPAKKRHLRAVPDRSVSRSRPRRTSVGKLLRTGLGIPKRRGWKLIRPKPAARRKARRALVKVATRAALNHLARFGRWNWTALRAWFAHLDLQVTGQLSPVPIHIPIPATPPKAERDIRRKYSHPRPKLTGRRTATPRKAATMSHPIHQAIVEAHALLASFQPQNATEIDQFLSGLGDMYSECASLVNNGAQQLSAEQPLHAAVIDSLTQLAAVHAGMTDVAGDAYNTFRSAHAEDLARLEQPRVNEQAWDVTRNQ